MEAADIDIWPSLYGIPVARAPGIFRGIQAALYQVVGIIGPDGCSRARNPCTPWYVPYKRAALLLLNIFR